jgi:protein-tyrosine phosphatase
MWPGGDEGPVDEKEEASHVKFKKCPRTGAQVEDWDYEQHMRKLPTKITDFLFLGNESNAQDQALVKKHDKITHILNVQRKGKTYYDASKDGVTTKIVAVDDFPHESLADAIAEGNEFIQKAKGSNGRVLVHCSTGISRGASIVIAFVMKGKKMTYKDAKKFVDDARKAQFQKDVKPNHGFARQLQGYEKEIGVG